MEISSLNELAQRIHVANSKWWHDMETGKPLERNPGELLMLVVTELSEATEGIRKDLMDDKIPHRKMEEVEMADAFIRLLDFSAGFHIKIFVKESDFGIPTGFDALKNKAEQMLWITNSVLEIYPALLVSDEKKGVAVSLSISMVMFYCTSHNLDLVGAFQDKMQFNAVREDHTHEARRAANGKKF